MDINSLKNRDETNPDPGIVKNQAQPSFLAVFHCTKWPPRAAPTPVIPPTMIWVELSGMPKKLATKITSDALDSAANP